jgi:hypothetical protein
MSYTEIFSLVAYAIAATIFIHISLKEKKIDDIHILPAEKNRCKESHLENTRTCMDPSYEIEAAELTLNTENGK